MARKRSKDVVRDACLEWGPTTPGMPTVSRLVAEAFDAGRAMEREAVVAHLREVGFGGGPREALALLGDLVDTFERGSHTREESGEGGER